MRNKQALSDIYGAIMATGGPTEDMSGHLKALQAEMDEREGMLRHYGELRDGPGDELVFEGRPVESTGEYQALQQKYMDLSSRYMDMFQNRHAAHETDTVVDNADSNSVNVTIDDLLEDIH